MVDLNDEKNDLMLFKVFFESRTFSRSVWSVVTLARFNATSCSIHDEVSNPDASPLNDMLTVLTCYTYLPRSNTKLRMGAIYKNRVGLGKLNLTLPLILICSSCKFLIATLYKHYITCL